MCSVPKYAILQNVVLLLKHVPKGPITAALLAYERGSLEKHFLMKGCENVSMHSGPGWRMREEST